MSDLIKLIKEFQKKQKQTLDLEKWSLSYFNETTKKIRLKYDSEIYPADESIKLICELLKISFEQTKKRFVDNRWLFSYTYIS